MKIFNQTKEWQEKVNFVDENNVVLGWDLSQSCCEETGWGIIDPSIKKGNGKSRAFIHSGKSSGVIDLPGWVFDPNHRKLISDSTMEFKIEKEGRYMLIHIWNVHEGYYAHGFTFERNGEIIEKGRI